MVASGRRLLVVLPAQIASYERRQETENARSRDEYDDDDRSVCVTATEL